MRGSRLAESLVKSQRPLEPDADNADAGRSAMRSCAHGYFFAIDEHRFLRIKTW